MNKNSIVDALSQYDNAFILGAYNELLVLRRTGTFPVGQKYFRDICDLRHRIYGSERSIDVAEGDLLNEIARRWASIQESKL